MSTRAFCGILGIFYLLIGIIAFLPALRTAPPPSAPTLDSARAYGYLFGQFPANAVHDVINIIIGLLGILFAARLSTAVAYSRFLFLLFGLATVAGLMPHANTLWGYAPILDGDVWVHAVCCVLAGFFGWVAVPEPILEPA